MSEMPKLYWDGEHLLVKKGWTSERPWFDVYEHNDSDGLSYVEEISGLPIFAVELVIKGTTGQPSPRWDVCVNCRESIAPGQASYAQDDGYAHVDPADCAWS